MSELHDAIDSFSDVVFSATGGVEGEDLKEILARKPQTYAPMGSRELGVFGHLDPDDHVFDYIESQDMADAMADAGISGVFYGQTGETLEDILEFGENIDEFGDEVF
jgi:hypothetical protein